VLGILAVRFVPFAVFDFLGIPSKPEAATVFVIRGEREAFMKVLSRRTPINGAGSDGRRNTCLEFTRRSLEA
jgi:hypothetical protein